jgi:hypothetical protein
MEQPIECRICGTKSNTTYIDLTSGLCQVCTSREVYYAQQQEEHGE